MKEQNIQKVLQLPILLLLLQVAYFENEQTTVYAQHHQLYK